MRSRPAAIVVLAVFLAACSGGPPASSPLREGRTVYGAHCSVCHGAAGQGGVGPALDRLGDDWPSCAGQAAWVTLGSEGWRAEHGDTYGATARPVVGGMPAHGPLLTAAQIAAVVAFERITYSRLDTAAVLADCGLD